MRRPTASAITSGGSAMCENFNRIIRNGNSASVCAKFWSKFFGRLRTIKRERQRFPEPRADWGLPKLRIRPESQRDFFATELPVRVTFQTGPDGKVHSLTIYPPRGQKGVPANKRDTQN